MEFKKPKVIDLIIVGSGLASLNFIDTYLQKKKHVHVISPNIDESLEKNYKKKSRILPTQMQGDNLYVDNYFTSNNLKVENNCKAIGSLKFGGLSNYWGLQIDSYLNKDQNNLKKSTFKIIERSLIEFLKKFKLLGSFSIGDKVIYKNDYLIPKFLNNLIDLQDNNFVCKKPILAFAVKKKINNLDYIDEEKSKITAKVFLKKKKKKKRLIFHNYYLKKIIKKKNYFELICKNKKNEKKLIAKKIIFASGTIATTKIIMDYLNVRKEVSIKHHPRLLSVFLSKSPIKSELKFTPSLIQIINKSKKDYYTADLRPGNKLITESIIDAFPFMRPFKYLLNLMRGRLLFSNILLDSSFSNLFIKKDKKAFKLYSKNKNIKKSLKERNKKIFKYLYKNKIIFPFFKTLFPGPGADYHYFGSIPFKSHGKLSVNNNCQLRSEKGIYIVDGSVFDFKTNKYPLGLMVANARRMGKLLSK